MINADHVTFNQSDSLHFSSDYMYLTFLGKELFPF